MLQTPKVALCCESVIVGEEECFIQNLLEWYCPSGAQMRLLYRGTRDGMEPAAFHRLCDDQGPTITIIKSTNNQSIFGGYTTASWSGNGHKTCDNTSLFTLTKPQEEDFSMKFDCNPQFRSHAIIADPNRGPTFSGNELSITGGIVDPSRGPIFIGNKISMTGGIGCWNTMNRFKAVGPHALVGQPFGLPIQRQFAVAEIEVFTVS